MGVFVYDCRLCRAAAMLPWGLELTSEMDDGIWFQDNEWIEPKPFDPEWYETKYAGELYEDDDDPHDVSLAQLVYQYTGAVLPRDMNRFDGLKKRTSCKRIKTVSGQYPLRYDECHW